MKPGISKSARDLLAKQPAAELHPSPDLLNGYVEQSLNSTENTKVLTHLSSCADCREVVFLASGAAEEEMQPELLVAAQTGPTLEPVPAATASTHPRPAETAKPQPRNWWKWATPLAALVIVGSTALIERDRIAELFSLPSTEMANVGGTMKVAPAMPATQPQALSLSPKQARKVAADRSANDVKLQARVDQSKMAKPAAKAQAGAKEDALRRKMSEAQIASNLQNAGANATAIPPSKPTPLPPSPSASTAVEVTSAAPLVQADNADLAANGVNSAAPNGGNDLTYSAPATIKPQPLAKSSLVANDQAAAGVTTMQLTRHQAANPHWRIGRDGQLERSTGTGTWAQKLDSEGITFHAVTTVGSEVWAGGNGGALFHSSDGGDHFNKVVLSANGLNESGAIVSIHFDTAQQGSVTSDSGATWATTDGGQSWSRQ